MILPPHTHSFRIFNWCEGDFTVLFNSTSIPHQIDVGIRGDRIIRWTCRWVRERNWEKHTLIYWLKNSFILKDLQSLRLVAYVLKYVSLWITYLFFLLPVRNKTKQHWRWSLSTFCWRRRGSYRTANTSRYSRVWSTPVYKTDEPRSAVCLYVHTQTQNRKLIYATELWRSIRAILEQFSDQWLA